MCLLNQSLAQLINRSFGWVESQDVVDKLSDLLQGALESHEALTKDRRAEAQDKANSAKGKAKAKRKAT